MNIHTLHSVRLLDPLRPFSHRSLFLSTRPPPHYQHHHISLFSLFPPPPPPFHQQISLDFPILLRLPPPNLRPSEKYYGWISAPIAFSFLHTFFPLLLLCTLNKQKHPKESLKNRLLYIFWTSTAYSSLLSRALSLFPIFIAYHYCITAAGYPIPFLFILPKQPSTTASLSLRFPVDHSYQLSFYKWSES